MDLFYSLDALTWMVPAILSILAIAVSLDARNKAGRALHSPPREQRARVVPSEPAYSLAFDPEIKAMKDSIRTLRNELKDLKQKIDDDSMSPVRSFVASPPRDLPAGGGGSRDTWDEPRVVEPAPVPAGRPVELQGGAVVPSRSLAAPGSLVSDGYGGGAKLYLNESVEINHVAFDQWSAFFDFRGGKPYMRYTTRQPAVVDWNESAGRGTLRDKGIAEPRA